MLHAVSRGAQTARTLSDDADVFFPLVYWCRKANCDMMHADGEV